MVNKMSKRIIVYFSSARLFYLEFRFIFKKH